MLGKIDWERIANRFENKSERFLHASRKLNILANDMLRYTDLCESLAHIAREGYGVKKEYELELIKQAEHIKKHGEKSIAIARKLNHLHERILKINKAFGWRGKELKKIEKRYWEHIKNFAKAIKT